MSPNMLPFGQSVASFPRTRGDEPTMVLSHADYQ